MIDYKWILQFCYEHYVLTTVFIIAIACIRPFGGMVEITYLTEDKESDREN